MTATAAPAQIQFSPARTHPTNIAQQSWIMVKRNMIHTKRMPEMLSDVTVQPIVFRAKNLSHPSFADLAGDAITPET